MSETPSYDYTRFFNASFPTNSLERDDDEIGLCYEYDQKSDIELAINVALATQRPLLVRGAPGCGKSSLARNIARKMGWRYLEEVITSRTRARDLLWRYDEIKRLSDARQQGVSDDIDYVTPGVLWWAFAPSEAAKHCREHRGVEAIEFPGYEYGPKPEFEVSGPPLPEVIVLLDEVDKADPDVPNDLLSVFSSHRFEVRGRPRGVTWDPLARPFVLLTTNGERELPGAFRRRCVMLKIDYPSEARLVEIAMAHQELRAQRHPDQDEPMLAKEQLEALAAKTHEIAELRETEHARVPGISEFLDAARALARLGASSGDDALFKALLGASLDKERALP